MAIGQEMGAWRGKARNILVFFKKTQAAAFLRLLADGRYFVVRYLPKQELTVVSHMSQTVPR